MDTQCPSALRQTDCALWTGAIELIETAETIAISGHTNPDGDALGTALGLGLALRARYPEKHVSFLLADDASVPPAYRFLSGAAEMIPACCFSTAPDLFISVDVPTLSRLEDAAEVAKRAKKILCIDHHPAEAEFTEHVVRVPSAAAVAILVEDLLAAAGIVLTADIANCLLTGIVTDTGRFQYQNTDPAALACASRLVAAGASPALISLEVYQSQRIEYLQLEALVMSRICTAATGRVAYSYVYADDLQRCGVASDECDGLVDVVRSVGGTELCLFLKEVDDGNIRGNLRSKGTLNVSAIAREQGGGGHAAAAGFTFSGTMEEALDCVLPKMIALVDSLDKTSATTECADALRQGA